ncbi:transcription factor bHLH148 [Silene latifolia]|uniref:transcription factor bHLH148 n=1 Tax=Silene latifolia TaxID=37657 RepID=UPI003D7892D7
MEQSRTITNPQASTSSSSSIREIIRRRKRIKTQISSSSTTTTTTNPSSSSWKSEKTQQLYSSKLLTALRNVHITPPSPSAPRRSRAVREAADKALAVAAKGRTRWSRAILTNKIKIKYMNQKHKRQKINVTGPSKLPQATRLLSLKGKTKELPGVERKVKTLGRLVPGCGKETLPVILEEATDYIPALEMQIRAMRDLLSRLTAASASTSASSPLPSEDTEMS